MRAALALLVVSLPLAASAQTVAPIPISDVDAACGRLSPREAVAPCIRQEQAAYEFVRTIWPALTDRGRERCIADAKALFGTASYYNGLASYVQGRLAIEQQQRDAVAAPRFRP